MRSLNRSTCLAFRRNQSVRKSSRLRMLLSSSCSQPVRRSKASVVFNTLNPSSTFGLKGKPGGARALLLLLPVLPVLLGGGLCRYTLCRLRLPGALMAEYGDRMMKVLCSCCVPSIGGDSRWELEAMTVLLCCVKDAPGRLGCASWLCAHVCVT